LLLTTFETDLLNLIWQDLFNINQSMIKIRMINILFLVFTALLSCDSKDLPQSGPDPIRTPESSSPENSNTKTDFYYGADLSYVNEMVECGAVYRNAQNAVEDPYTIFSDAGANLVRVRYGIIQTGPTIQITRMY
jgi:hypothetical protein